MHELEMKPSGIACAKHTRSWVWFLALSDGKTKGREARGPQEEYCPPNEVELLGKELLK